VGPGLLFGAGHPYSVLSSGTEASIAALGRDELVGWVKQRLRPDRATLIVVGDTTLADIQPMLEQRFTVPEPLPHMHQAAG
jgi:predicted Zn-dependent peptidase